LKLEKKDLKSDVENKASKILDLEV